jgi:hypothetical protein
MHIVILFQEVYLIELLSHKILEYLNQKQLKLSKIVSFVSETISGTK